ncbi:MAG: hypothetical protein WDO71_08040 [Bacteroidota bacterium]
MKQHGARSFAREYLLINGTDYEFSDLLTIAGGQLALEDEYSSRLEKTIAFISRRRRSYSLVH